MTQARDLGDAANKANFLDNIDSDLAALIAAATVPSGIIQPFGGASAPTGYLACDGSAVSRTTYAALFAAIGTTWGAGDGSTTFAVPDLRGAFLRGTGSHGTSNMADGNDFAGPSVGSFENDQFQGHLFGDVGAYVGATQTAPLKISDNRRNQSPSSSADNNHGVVDTQANSYGNALIPIDDQTNGTPRTGDETRPFNAGILYCIKT